MTKSAKIEPPAPPQPDSPPSRAENLSGLAEGSCREFQFRSGEGLAEGFVVKSAGRPHTGAPPDWRPERFLTEAGDYHIRALHGALFRIEDGSCVNGPCHGQALEKLEPPLEA